MVALATCCAQDRWHPCNVSRTSARTLAKLGWILLRPVEVRDNAGSPFSEHMLRATPAGRAAETGDFSQTTKFGKRSGLAVIKDARTNK